MFFLADGVKNGHDSIPNSHSTKVGSTAMNQKEQDAKMAQLISKCWTDANFKRKLVADAASVLKAEGLEVPPGL
ncbi:MAG TPA: hypothetical protein VGH65_04895, partial [Verrucomicrobiaceae bacterium]